MLTNAAGGISRGMPVGEPVLIADHLNLTAASPLVGARFVDLTDLYSPALRARAREIDPTLTEGVYAGLPGPHFETPAEIRMLRGLGADLVGMSTVLEAIAARSAEGSRCSGSRWSPTSPPGITGAPLDHHEVLAAGAASAGRMGGLLPGTRVLTRRCATRPPAGSPTTPTPTTATSSPACWRARWRAPPAPRTSSPTAWPPAALRHGRAARAGAAGPSGMNVAVVRRATAGLAAGCPATGRGTRSWSAATPGTAPTRSRGRRPAFAGAGFTVHVLPAPPPTPVLAFAVRHLGAGRASDHRVA